MAMHDKKREQLIGDSLTAEVEIARRFKLTPADQERMHSQTPGDPVSDYIGHASVQARMIQEEREQLPTQDDQELLPRLQHLGQSTLSSFDYFESNSARDQIASGYN
ncbi:MAG TPA: hypothetical protein VLF79_04205 [Candidatus Saccharimonadales bacterium]|nr:hypothetical protein [Candidatus Saccharimonadales bacterium]